MKEDAYMTTTSSFKTDLLSAYTESPTLSQDQTKVSDAIDPSTSSSFIAKSLASLPPTDGVVTSAHASTVNTRYTPSSYEPTLIRRTEASHVRARDDILPRYTSASYDGSLIRGTEASDIRADDIEELPDLELTSIL